MIDPTLQTSHADVTQASSTTQGIGLRRVTGHTRLVAAVEPLGAGLIQLTGPHQAVLLPRQRRGAIVVEQQRTTLRGNSRGKGQTNNTGAVQDAPPCGAG